MKLRLLILSAITALVGATLFVPAAIATAPGLPNATLIGDVNSAEAGSDVRFVTVFNNTVYFQATDFEGAELWKSTGGAAVKVVDLNSSGQGSAPYALTVFRDKLYFFAIRADGTWLFSLDENENIVAIVQVAASTAVGGAYGALRMTASSDHLFFTQAGEFGGTELYSWAPQLGDASTIVQISFAANSANTDPSNINVFGSNALFTGRYNGSSFGKILEYNGTGIVVHENMDMRGSVLYNGLLYFLGWNSDFGSEVWTYDGTTLNRLTDLAPGRAYGEPNDLTVMGGDLYFSGFYGSSDRVLLKLNGSDATVITGAPSGTGVMPTSITAVGSKLYVTYTTNSGVEEFWVTTGVSLNRADSLPTPIETQAFSIAALGADLYYTTAPARYNNELVKVNTTNNTVTALITQNQATQNSWASNFGTFKGKMYFVAYTPEFGREWYSYDGMNNPVLLRDINQGSNFGASEEQLQVVGDNMYFPGDDGRNGQELWVYNGVTAPRMVSDQTPGAESSYPLNLMEFNGSLYYTTIDGRLWSLSRNGALQQVQIDASNVLESLSANSLTVFNNKLYFSASYQPSGGTQTDGLLFSTDGVSPATLVTQPESAPRSIGNLHATPNFLYFSGTSSSGDTGQELYRISKNNNQPLRMTDLALGNSGSYPMGMGYFNSLFYFITQSPAGEMFTINEAGTITQVQISDGQGSYPKSMTSIGDTLYWIGQAEIGNPNNSMYAVWSQTAGGAPVKESETYTIRDRDILPMMTVFKGQLYFTADDQIHGREVFKIGADSIIRRVNVSKNIVGFKAKKFVLSTAMRNSIRSFVNANPTGTVAKCVGQTAVGNKTIVEKNLAKARANSVCAYVASIQRGIQKSVSTATGKKAGKAFNRVVLTLRN